METNEQDRNLLLLWGGVVAQCVSDHLKKVKSRGRLAARKEEPALWILDDSSRPGGFLWCCALLDINPDSFRREMDNPSLAAAIRGALKCIKGRAATTPKAKDAVPARMVAAQRKNRLLGKKLK